MLRFLVSLLAVLSVLAFPARAADGADSRPVVRVGTFDAPPAAFHDEHGRFRGYLADLLDRIATEAGFVFEVHRYASAKAVTTAARHGEIDVALPLLATDERRKSFDFIEPLAMLSLALLAGPDSPEGGADFDALAGKRVAMIGDGYIDDFVHRRQPRVEPVRERSDAEVLTSLAFGRAQYAVMEMSRAVYYLRKMGLDDFHIVAESPDSYPVMMAVFRRDGSDRILAAINEALSRIPPSQRQASIQHWTDPLGKPWYQTTAALLSALALALAGLLAAGSTLLYRRRLRGEQAAQQRQQQAEREHARQQLQASEARYRHQALHDGLTGLPNRCMLEQHLGQALQRAAQRRQTLAVFFLDADNFKHINDAQGHSAGDQLLQALGRRFERMGDRVFVARFGGDEFVAVAEGALGDAQVESLARELLREFSRPVAIDGQDAYLTTSIGVALYPEHGTTADALMAAADTAMYAAKAGGRNTWRPYSSTLGQVQSAKAQALQDLRNALDRDELLLHYQPKIELASGRWVGVEALLRWRAPDGLRGPAGLIEAAEESGIITALGEWVIRTAAAQSRAWREQGVDLPIAVNVSVKQLQDDRFVPFLQDQVEHDPALARLLELELTESSLAVDAEHAYAVLDALKALGLRLHVDDFGTGYSSLSYLSRMPVDTLKIDRSFVAGLPDRLEACEIATAVLALARALGLDVVAEGVETARQAEFLRERGCGQAQGYFFARPMLAEVLPGCMGRAAQPLQERGATSRRPALAEQGVTS